MDVDQMFEKYKGRKIALYGLGTETKKALENLENAHEIVGLLDSFRISGELYGKQIISFDEAVNAGIKLIIVAARPGSCRAITKRIGDRCRQNGIALMDIRGKDLLEPRKVSYCFSDADGVTRAELEDKIKNADVVSFDLFDTLVMRQTLYSDDVAAYVDCRLKENGIYIEDFCTKRLESEKLLSRDKAPALIEIYQNLLNKLDNSSVLNVTAPELAELEWDIDFSLLVPRKEVCEIFRKAACSGKSIYIVSDTYYSKCQLAGILERCNIRKYTDILSSSEYRMSKTQGLYRVLKDKEGAKKYLHIGDDIVADIENANNWGFETCRLFSGLDLLENLGSLGLSEYVNSLSDHLKVGVFVSKIFNSPFQFENEDRQTGISDVYDIGYQICGPMISDFVCWFCEKAEEEKIQNIWFGARDGYLIKKMYGYLLQTSGREDKSVYFLTSRTAAVRAGVNDEDDIRYIDEMKYSGTLEQNLKERFGISAGNLNCKYNVPDEKGLMGYKEVILERARQSYENYQRYIDKLKIEKGDIAFFDFVAKGTAQKFIQHLIPNHVKGFYFLQLETGSMKDKKLDICSFYEQGESDLCTVFEDYYILETLLTAPHPSVTDFNANGRPVYALETRTDKDILCFERAQEGILDYFKTYIRLCPKAERTVNKKLDEVFLGLIHKVRITALDFLDLTIEDPFFNRMTNVTDIL